MFFNGIYENNIQTEPINKVINGSKYSQIHDIKYQSIIAIDFAFFVIATLEPSFE